MCKELSIDYFKTEELNHGIENGIYCKQKISVIVLVYNVEQYFRQALDSLTNQSYRNLQIFLIDDGSSDRSGEICDEYATKDPRVTVVHKKNGGVSLAHNVGLRRL